MHRYPDITLFGSNVLQSNVLHSNVVHDSNELVAVVKRHARLDASLHVGQQHGLRLPM